MRRRRAGPRECPATATATEPGSAATLRQDATGARPRSTERSTARGSLLAGGPERASQARSPNVAPAVPAIEASRARTRFDRFTSRRTAAVGDEAFTHSPVASRRNTGSPRYPSSTTVWPGFTVTPRARSLWKIWAEYAVGLGMKHARPVVDRDRARAQMRTSRRRSSEEDDHGDAHHQRGDARPARASRSPVDGRALKRVCEARARHLGDRTATETAHARARSNRRCRRPRCA